MPQDSDAQLSRALAPLRFCLDRRTGAIVVDDSAIADAGEVSNLMPREETTMALGEKSQTVVSLGGDSERR